MLNIIVVRDKSYRKVSPKQDLIENLCTSKNILRPRCIKGEITIWQSEGRRYFANLMSHGQPRIKAKGTHKNRNNRNYSIYR